MTATGSSPNKLRTDAPSGHGADLGVQDARQGQTTGHVRWMLRISVVLAVVAMAGVGAWYATHSPASATPPAAASSQPH